MNFLKSSLLAISMVTGSLAAQPLEVKATVVKEEKADLKVLGQQFDKLSDEYVAGRSGYSNQIYDVLTETAKKAFPDLSQEKLSALDLGTGTGIVVRAIREKGFSNIKATDISENQIAKAKEADPEHASDYIVAPSEKLPFEDKSFDVVTAFAAFHWFCNDDSVKEISRVLKDGGFFFVVNSKGSNELKDGADQVIQDSGIVFEHPRHTYDPTIILKEHGFTVVEETVSVSKTLTSVDNVLANLKSRSSWGLVKGTDKEAEITQKLEQFVKELFEKNGGAYTDTSNRRIVIAYKPASN